MADGRHIENRFFAISRRHIGQFMQVSERRRTAAILKIALSPYLSRELSDFNQIWYADANLHSEYGYLKKSKFLKFKMADGRHIENRFVYISAPYWRINVKFGME